MLSQTGEGEELKGMKKALIVSLLAALVVGLVGGIWFQYRDSVVVIELVVTSDHDDRFHFYSDYGDGWEKDEWARPIKAKVATKLHLKFSKNKIKRFKFEPLRKAGEIRFESIQYTDRIDRPLRPFPLEKITPKKDIELVSEPEQLPMVFKVPEGAKDPQIYVNDAREWEFSTRRDLWDSRMLWTSLRIAFVSFLLILPVTMTQLRDQEEMERVK